MKKIGLLLLLFLFSAEVNAGLYAFTIHSRANCANNESISWWANHSLYLFTVSDHFFGDGVHELKTGWEFTWRSAAVHWREAYPGNVWRVIGSHWGADSNGNAYYIGGTAVVDCSIYDGWWG